MCIITQKSIIYLLWGVDILLNMIGRVDVYQYCEAFASKICLKLKEISLEITNLLIENIIHIGVMRELMMMMIMMQILEMKIKETIVMREVYVIREIVVMKEYMVRIKMVSHQTTVQPLLHTITIEGLK
ncbi:hypothetical protein Peur_000948 [Populus x canadensis]